MKLRVRLRKLLGDSPVPRRKKEGPARKPFAWLVSMLVIVAVPAFATIFSTVKGVVHDPQHRPVPGAVVTLKARQADWAQTATTDADRTFQFAAVPVGDYTVT